MLTWFSFGVLDGFFAENFFWKYFVADSCESNDAGGVGTKSANVCNISIWHYGWSCESVFAYCWSHRPCWWIKLKNHNVYGLCVENASWMSLSDWWLKQSRTKYSSKVFWESGNRLNSGSSIKRLNRGLLNSAFLILFTKAAGSFSFNLEKSLTT